jgi:hypothetical protein
MRIAKYFRETKPDIQVVHQFTALFSFFRSVILINQQFVFHIFIPSPLTNFDIWFFSYIINFYKNCLIAVSGHFFVITM